MTAIPDEPGDWDDLAERQGLEAVRLAFMATVANGPPPDPLAGIVKRATRDPGAPFAPDVLRSLVALRGSDQAAFEKVRAQLKRVGVRVGSLDGAIAGTEGSSRGPTQADILIELAGAADLFHTPDGDGYADLEIDGHRETWGLRTKAFRRWLVRRFFEASQRAPSSEALQAALNVIEARATFDAPERPVFVRVGGHQWPPLSGLGGRHMASDRD